MSDFPPQVYALSAAARELRLTLLDNQAKVSWVDACSHTHLLEEWKALREEYRMMLDESESAATRLATAMNAYVALQEYMDDPTLLDDFIEELEGLDETLSNMNFCQDDDFRSLRSRFEKLSNDINLLLRAHTAPVEDQTNASREAFTRSPQVPAMNAIATQYLSRFVWGRSDHVAHANSTRTGPIRAETTNASGKPPGGAGIQAMPAVLQLIDKNLETQSRLSRVALVDIKDKLAHEIRTYLTALRNSRSNASPETQLALRNATRRVTSSTGSWRERANALTEGYAKVPK
ncbi:hypothetical protein K466DRAFT_585386 [Polyporus arcularius HHB13444]|uniref:Uncharacterized protein n=1 Tax=Polyporus arcularius HHB13444 TaxID=1314778 RepID=A0A5C3PR90_9APHY|nr:hypothetical protein K466DRAFT_585386 [Polyporus arcularius HHB13444]